MNKSYGFFRTLVYFSLCWIGISYVSGQRNEGGREGGLQLTNRTRPTVAATITTAKTTTPTTTTTTTTPRNNDGSTKGRWENPWPEILEIPTTLHPEESSSTDNYDAIINSEGSRNGSNITQTRDGSTYIPVESEPGPDLKGIIIAIVALVALLASTVFIYIYCRPVISGRELEEFFGGNVAKQIQGNEDGTIQAKSCPFNAKIRSGDLQFSGGKVGKRDDEGSDGFQLSEGTYKGGKVMIKSVTRCGDKAYFKRVLSEVKIMAFVGKHAYIVEFLGAVTSGVQRGTIHVVLEYSPYGNLGNYLQDNAVVFYENLNQPSHKSKRLPRKNSARTQLSQYTFYYWAEQISDGMQYLHNKKVVHGELAAKNILVFDNNRIKISEFASERYQYEYEHCLKKETELLAWRWLSIETLQKFQFTKEADMWSFGVLLWEMFSLGKVPYHEMEWSQDFEDRLVAGVRLERTDFISVDLYKLMTECWSSDPKKRPSFLHLKDYFYRLRNDILVSLNEVEEEEDTVVGYFSNAREAEPKTEVSFESG